MEFSRREYWSGLPFPSPGDLPDPGIEPRSPVLQADSLPSEIPGNASEAAGFPDGSDGKEPTCNVGDLGSTPGLGKSPGVGNANPLQYFGLENSMDRGACWAIPSIGSQRVRHD